MAKVHPTNEHMVFAVDSDSDETAYRVDLAAEDGDGQCNCGHFQFRVSPARKAGEKKWCKHLLSAYGYFGWSQAREIARIQKEHARKRGIRE